MTTWYKQSFGKDYLAVYKHRNLQKAYEEVREMVNWLELSQGARVLDLCCGMGRHAVALSEFGYSVTGVDLSEVLLDEAVKHDQANEVLWLHGDMRDIPIYNDQYYDAIVNLFTSFGYFAKDEENVQVLHEIHRLLKPGGRFIIDYLNAEYVRTHLVPYSERETDGMTIQEHRAIEDGVVTKRIVIYEGDLPPRQYMERVKLYGRADFESMLAQAKLQIDGIYGDYSQSTYEEHQSPRLIIVGHKQDDRASNP